MKNEKHFLTWIFVFGMLFISCIGFANINFNDIDYISFNDGEVESISIDGTNVWNRCPPTYFYFDNGNVVEQKIYGGLGRQYENDQTLTNVVVGKRVTSIGPYSFSNCLNLVSVEMPNTVSTIWGYSFDNCSNLASINLSTNLKYISQYAFRNCTKIESLSFPNSLTNIGNFTFQNCTGLTNLDLGNGLKNIGYRNTNSYSFQNCTGLTHIHIPSNVVDVGRGIFTGCSNLVSATVDEGIKSMDYMFMNCKKLRQLTIPNSVESAQQVCNGCSALTNVIIGSGLKSLTSYTFAQTRLAYVHVPGNVKSIGSSAFNLANSAMKWAKVDEGCTSIAANAFSYNYGLTNAVFPNSVQSIGNRCFYDNNNLLDVQIGDENGDPINSPQVLGSEVFANNTSKLRTLTIGNGITSLGTNTFTTKANCPQIVQYYKRPSETFEDARTRVETLIANTGKDISTIPNWICLTPEE